MSVIASADVRCSGEEKIVSPGVLVGQARAGATHTFPLHFSCRQLLSEAQCEPIAPPVPDTRGALVLKHLVLESPITPVMDMDTNVKQRVRIFSSLGNCRLYAGGT